MWVIFEGLDKSGKGTLEWGLHKATNFKHIVIDRGPVGYLTFDKIFNRDTKDRDEYFIKQSEKAMTLNNFFVVYCTVNKNTAITRIESNNEICPYDYEKAQEIYRDNIYKYYKDEKVLEIDTTFLSIERCIEIIVQKIKEWEEGLESNE